MGGRVCVCEGRQPQVTPLSLLSLSPLSPSLSNRLYADIKYYETTLSALEGTSGPGMEMDSFFRIRFGRPPAL